MNGRPQLIFAFAMLLAGCLAAQQGLKAEYYDGKDFNVKAATRIDAKIDFSWLDHPPVPGINPNVCSIRWTGRLLSPESGTYTFSAKVDDGIRVWVGGILVIDAWDLHDEGSFAGKVKMEKGKQYDLKVEYFNALVEGEIRLLWELPSGKGAKVVDSQYFYQTPEKPVQKAPSKPAAEPKKPSKPKPQPDAGKKAPAKPPKPKDAAVHADTLQKYVPKNVHFEQAKSILLPESHAELDKLAAFLNRNPELRLTIEGHTDVIGDSQKNMKLSQERAAAVAIYLSEKGVGASRMEAIGYGGARPLIHNKSKTSCLENRRVAFVLR